VSYQRPIGILVALMATPLTLRTGWIPGNVGSARDGEALEVAAAAPLGAEVADETMVPPLRPEQAETAATVSSTTTDSTRMALIDFSSLE
jgi:hypothetical protein